MACKISKFSTAHVFLALASLPIINYIFQDSKKRKKLDSDRKELLPLKSLKPYILKHRLRIKVCFFFLKKKKEQKILKKNKKINMVQSPKKHLNLFIRPEYKMWRVQHFHNNAIK